VLRHTGGARPVGMPAASSSEQGRAA